MCCKESRKQKPQSNKQLCGNGSVHSNVQLDVHSEPSVKVNEPIVSIQCDPPVCVYSDPAKQYVKVTGGPLFSDHKEQ